MSIRIDKVQINSTTHLPELLATVISGRRSEVNYIWPFLPMSEPISAEDKLAERQTISSLMETEMTDAEWFYFDSLRKKAIK